MLRIKRNRHATLQGSTVGTLPTGIYQVDDYNPGMGIYYYIQKGSPFKYEIYDGTKAATLAGGADKIIRIGTYLVNDYIPMLAKGIHNIMLNPSTKTYKVYEATDYGTIIYNGDLQRIKEKLYTNWPLSEVDSNKNISHWDELKRFETGSHVYNVPSNLVFDRNEALAQLKTNYDAALAAYNAANTPATTTVTTSPTTTTTTPTTTTPTTTTTPPQGIDKNIIIALALGATGVAAWYFTRSKKRK